MDLIRDQQDTKSACDVPLTERTTQESHLQLNHAVEIIGKVQNDLSVKVMASTDFGPEGEIGMCYTYIGLYVVSYRPGR